MAAMGRHREQSSQTFEQYYSACFAERWPGLRAALRARRPQFDLRRLGLNGSYRLDPASLLLSRLLVRQLSAIGKPALRLWDMCAAPGGKMLGLLLLQQSCHQAAGGGSQTVELLASEISGARFARLQQQKALLPEALRQQVQLQRADACQLALRHKAAGLLFDAILLDAPCSSESHVLQKPELLARWRSSRSKRNARTQLALLCAGLDCLAPGGVLLYATCALSPLENAAVVAKALRKRSGRGLGVAVPGGCFAPQDYPDWHFEQLYTLSGDSDPGGTASNRADFIGYSILPDRQLRHPGSGPLYFCLLQRQAV